MTPIINDTILYSFKNATIDPNDPFIRGARPFLFSILVSLSITPRLLSTVLQYNKAFAVALSAFIRLISKINIYLFLDIINSNKDKIKKL